jgi:hypothetical protein
VPLWIHLGPGGFTAGIAARLTLVLPGDDEIAAVEDGDLRPVLTSLGGRVDLEFLTDLVVVGIEDLGADLRTRCVDTDFGVARIRPGNHIAAIRECRHRRKELSARRGRVRGKLAADLVDGTNSVPRRNRQSRRVRNRSNINGRGVNRGHTMTIDQRIVECGNPAEIFIRPENHFSLVQGDGSVNRVGNRLQSLTTSIGQRCGCD